MEQGRGYKEEQPCISSPFGRLETRESWNYVLHSSEVHLPYRTCGASPWIVTKFLVLCKGALLQANLKRSHPWLATTRDGWQLPGGLRKETVVKWPGPKAVRVTAHAVAHWRHAFATIKGDSPVCLSHKHCGSPSPCPAHARVERFACSRNFVHCTFEALGNR